MTSPVNLHSRLERLTETPVDLVVVALLTAGLGGDLDVVAEVHLPSSQTKPPRVPGPSRLATRLAMNPKFSSTFAVSQR